jgi:glycosyltransferase involved in cell wall biosynthesis
MKISLIIPAYNEENYIGECIDCAILASHGRLHEIIVVNNASTDKTKEIAIRKGVRVVDEPEKGLTKARQRGLIEATGDYIAYIDADTRMPNDWFDKIEYYFSKKPDIVCLSGPYKYYDASLYQRIVMSILWYTSAPIVYRFVGYMVLGGNFITKKSALLDIGGFDKNIDFFGEDTDIARRLSKTGKVVFKMDFFIRTSCRRLKKEGLIITNIKYGLNFIWEVFFHRPFTNKSTDIRIKKHE